MPHSLPYYLLHEHSMFSLSYDFFSMCLEGKHLHVFNLTELLFYLEKTAEGEMYSLFRVERSPISLKDVFYLPFSVFFLKYTLFFKMFSGSELSISRFKRPLLILIQSTYGVPSMFNLTTTL